MDLPRISIVTPSYNQGQFIEETILSVIDQGYPNLEYIIMDGGSTDDTVEIIRKHEPRITYWISEKDRGQAHAVNKGWARATGEILGWLNSDDFYLPGALHRVAEAYMKGGSGLIYGDCQVADAQSHALPGIKHMANYSLTRLLSEFTMPQPAVFVTRNFISKIGMLDEHLKYAMDYDFFIRAWLSKMENQFSYIPQVLAISREHENTKCATGFKKGESVFTLENIQVLKQLAKLYIEQISQETHLKQAFAIALARQARKLSWTGSNWQAFLYLLEALFFCPSGVLQYIIIQAKNIMFRGPSRGRV